MPSAIEAIAALKERLAREKELPIKAVQVTPVDVKELEQLERTLGKVLPEAYLQFITRHGLFRATDWRGQERARMLSAAGVPGRRAVGPYREGIGCSLGR